MPVISTLWEAKAGGPLEVRSSRWAWSTWRNPVSTKHRKLAGVVAGACNPSYLGGWVRRIPWTREAESAVSQDRATVLQPGQQSKMLSKKKIKRKEIETPSGLFPFTTTSKLFLVPREAITRYIVTQRPLQRSCFPQQIDETSCRIWDNSIFYPWGKKLHGLLS